MRIDWQAIARLIAMLSKIAMDWYRLVSANPDDDERKARKAVAIILDPDRPEEDVDEIEL